MSESRVFKPDLLLTNNNVAPRLGSKVKLSDNLQAFYVIVTEKNGTLLFGTIDNIIDGKPYKYGDKIMFYINNIIIE